MIHSRREIEYLHERLNPVALELAKLRERRDLETKHWKTKADRPGKPFAPTVEPQ